MTAKRFTASAQCAQCLCFRMVFFSTSIHSKYVGDMLFVDIVPQSIRPHDQESLLSGATYPLHIGRVDNVGFQVTGLQKCNTQANRVNAMG